MMLMIMHLDLCNWHQIVADMIKVFNCCSRNVIWTLPCTTGICCAVIGSSDYFCIQLQSALIAVAAHHHIVQQHQD